MRCKFSLSKAVQNHSSLILQKFISHSYHIITEGWERGCACGGLSNVLADRSFAGSYIHIYIYVCVYTHTHTHAHISVIAKVGQKECDVLPIGP